MTRKPQLTSICFLLFLLAACAPETPSPAAGSPVPAATASPTPAPTATPVPPAVLDIRWPEQVSALEPVPIEVALIPPPGLSVTSTVRAAVFDPQGDLYRRLFPLKPQGGDEYAAENPLELPLEPVAGDWRMKVYVHTVLDVEGEQEITFQPAPIPFHVMTGVLPAEVDIHVPEPFAEAMSQGNQEAGGRVWRYGSGELGLWWAPGPVEPLQLSTALVILEMTHGSAGLPQVLGVQETAFQERKAFLFREEWPGTGGGPAEALVVRGDHYHLYVLRIRATGGETIPRLMRQVWHTFSFTE